MPSAMWRLTSAELVRKPQIGTTPLTMITDLGGVEETPAHEAITAAARSRFERQVHHIVRGILSELSWGHSSGEVGLP